MHSRSKIFVEYSWIFSTLLTQIVYDLAGSIAHHSKNKLTYTIIHVVSSRQMKIGAVNMVSLSFCELLIQPKKMKRCQTRDAFLCHFPLSSPRCGGVVQSVKCILLQCHGIVLLSEVSQQKQKWKCVTCEWYWQQIYIWLYVWFAAHTNNCHIEMFHERLWTIDDCSLEIYSTKNWKYFIPFDKDFGIWHCALRKYSFFPFK